MMVGYSLYMSIVELGVVGQYNSLEKNIFFFLLLLHSLSYSSPPSSPIIYKYLRNLTDIFSSIVDLFIVSSAMFENV